ncbi:hypothetical protein PMZ80_008485 [Knufia obscura]|uniref:RING-type E3 ubiquitin transferase n=1 Tax=Knufia obscura TaxID=1635080 RepID=A0ABR0REX8_9EURO|nr:hypothetical protein PMZ80_008485 [Knufia obscura]
MEGPRLTLLIVLLLFIFFSPDQPNIRYHSRREQERLANEKQQDFNALANSTYGDLPATGLNLTGLRIEDGYQLQLVPTAQEISRKQQIDSWYGFDRLTPVYHDIDGQVKGDFVRVDAETDPARMLNLTELDPGADYLTSSFDRNVSDAKGQLMIDLDDVDHGSKFLSRDIKATITIYTDSSPGNGWEAKLRGVHFPSGQILLTTSSRKYNALPALPHFALTEGQFHRATSTMNTSLTNIWQYIDQGQVDDTALLIAPKCELVVWLHQKPLVGSNLYIDEIERELREPDGAPIGQPPPLAFSAVVFSPDCGYILQADTVFGPKTEAYSDLVRRITAAFCMMLVGQIVLLKRQMEKCATPSTRSRVSYHTFGIAAFCDGLMLFALVGVLVADISIFLLAGTAAFLCCIHVAFLEVKFIFDIWTVQVGDPAAAQRERQRRAAATANTINNTNTNAAPARAPATNAATPTAEGPAAATAPTPPTSEEGLPLPATAAATNPPTIILPPDQDGTGAQDISPRASFASLYSRFYFALINLMFFTLWATSWSPTPRHIYFNFLAFSFFSLWLPQIYRNIMRNCRKALTVEYVVGTSVLRAVPILYWYVDDRNILFATTNPRTATLLLGWLWLQIMVLLSQQFLGPRLFIPEKWCPPAYDYHPILYDDLEAGGLPIGEITSASEGKDASTDKDKTGSRKVFDCAVCMNEIDVPVVSKDEKAKSGAGRSWLEQRNYMVTPCRHIFHSECLEVFSEDLGEAYLAQSSDNSDSQDDGDESGGSAEETYLGPPDDEFELEQDTGYTETENEDEKEYDYPSPILRTIQTQRPMIQAEKTREWPGSAASVVVVLITLTLQMTPMAPTAATTSMRRKMKTTSPTEKDVSWKLCACSFLSVDDLVELPGFTAVHNSIANWLREMGRAFATLFSGGASTFADPHSDPEEASTCSDAANGYSPCFPQRWAC